MSDPRSVYLWVFIGLVTLSDDFISHVNTEIFLECSCSLTLCLINIDQWCCSSSSTVLCCVLSCGILIIFRVSAAVSFIMFLSGLNQVYCLLFTLFILCNILQWCSVCLWRLFINLMVFTFWTSVAVIFLILMSSNPVIIFNFLVI